MDDGGYAPSGEFGGRIDGLSRRFVRGQVDLDRPHTGQRLFRLAEIQADYAVTFQQARRERLSQEAAAPRDDDGILLRHSVPPGDGAVRDGALAQTRRPQRSAERRVGKEWVSTCRSRWGPDN